MKRSTKANAMRAFHKCIEHCLELFENVAITGLSVISKGSRKIQLHHRFFSCVAELPETEDLLSLKRGFQAVMPCHMCFDNKSILTFMH